MRNSVITTIISHRFSDLWNMLTVADPNINFWLGGANLMCIPVSHVYLFLGMGSQSL